MKIAVGCDHRAREHKEIVKRVVEAMGGETLDVGTHDEGVADYPRFALAVARAVSSGEADKGVLMCSTGIGMSIAANKVRGVRAAVAYTPELAALSRRHNDANVLCFGGSVVPLDNIEELVRAWLTAEFEGGRHAGRVCMITEAEG